MGCHIVGERLKTELDMNKSGLFLLPVFCLVKFMDRIFPHCLCSMLIEYYIIGVWF